MALLLVDQYTAASDPVYQSRITMSLQQAAVAIANEAISTPNHANRINLARAVLLNHSQFVQEFSWACAGQGMDNTSTDVQINNAVSAVWNGVAGVP